MDANSIRLYNLVNKLKQSRDKKEIVLIFGKIERLIEVMKYQPEYNITETDLENNIFNEISNNEQI